MLKFIAGVILIVIVLGWFENDEPKEVVVEPQITVLSAEEKALEKDAYLKSLSDDLEHIKSTTATMHSDAGEAKLHINIMLAVLNNYAAKLAEQKKYDVDQSDLAFVAEYKRELSAAQARVLPVLRDQYGPVLRAALWELDIAAKTIGKGFRTINFVGGAFAANRNIKELQVQFFESFSQLRFKRTQYRWREGADKYTYYDLKTPDDTVIGTWNNSSFVAL